MPKLVIIKNYPTRTEAEIAKQFLESQGIQCVVSADDMGGMRHDLLMATGGAKLLCREEDRENAFDLLKSI
ncbi:MAG TPA: hypothetical protein VGA53_01335 [Candidatus Paceibacterota bacterium]